MGVHDGIFPPHPDSILGSLRHIFQHASDGLKHAAQSAATWAEAGLTPHVRPAFQYKGPTIPAPYQPCTNAFQDLALLSSAVSLGQSWSATPQYPPAALALAGGWVVAYSFGPVPLRAYGLCARAAWQDGQLWRLGTAPLLHRSLPHLACDLAALVPEATVVAAARGPWYLGGALAFSALLSQGLYVLASWAASKLGWPAGLSESYSSAYVLTPTAVTLALKVVGGYLTEPGPVSRPGPRHAVEDDFGASLTTPFGQGRHGAWLTLGWVQAVSRGAAPAADACGILAGLLIVYGEAAWEEGLARWRRRGLRRAGALAAGWRPRRYWGLGWEDVLSQLVMGAGTLSMLALASRKGGAL